MDVKGFDFADWWGEWEDLAGAGAPMPNGKVDRRIWRLQKKLSEHEDTAAAARIEAVKESLFKYHISDLNKVGISLEPQPVTVRTFQSSNFLAVFRCFHERLAKLPTLPIDYVFTAAQELIRYHIGKEKVGAEWLLTFHKVVDQMRLLPESRYNPADAGETAEYLWTRSIDPVFTHTSHHTSLPSLLIPHYSPYIPSLTVTTRPPPPP